MFVGLLRGSEIFHIFDSVLNIFGFLGIFATVLEAEVPHKFTLTAQSSCLGMSLLFTYFVTRDMEDQDFLQYRAVSDILRAFQEIPNFSN